MSKRTLATLALAAVAASLSCTARAPAPTTLEVDRATPDATSTPRQSADNVRRAEPAYPAPAPPPPPPPAEPSPIAASELKPDTATSSSYGYEDAKTKSPAPKRAADGPAGGDLGRSDGRDGIVALKGGSMKDSLAPMGNMPAQPPRPAPMHQVATEGARAFGGGEGLAGKKALAHTAAKTDTRLDMQLGQRPFDKSEAREKNTGDDDFAALPVNPLVDARVDNLSTFAVDVDTGSFSLSRRYLESGSLPMPAGVRVEEWVNAFHYDYAGPDGDKTPFAIHVEGAPLAKQSYVLRIGIQGKRIAKQARDPMHLVFLVDVSGSMRPVDRLPLAKQSLALLVNELDERDSVSVVTYAGHTGLVLPATTVTSSGRAQILDAIDGLKAGGGTNMGSGMELAYREANKALGNKGISRVIVLTDGDTNIGHLSFADIMRSVHGYVSEGVTLSTVGFGTGNYRDDLLEKLADSGNGNYSYIGSMKDAHKAFVDDLTGTLQVIAKDAKVQVEMNRDVVASYRLIGYEDRDIADRDFRNDKVDAGEIGAGHTVTALYEVVLKDDEPSGDIATVRVRYKEPHGSEKATEVATRFPSTSLSTSMNELTADGRYAVGVGLAAEVFRHSPHMSRLGIGLAYAEELLASGAVGPYASERSAFARLIAPLSEGAPVASR